MKKEKLCDLLEILRWSGIVIGYFLAFNPSYSPTEQLNFLCFFLVIPVAGLTGIESVFLSDTAARQSGYGVGSPYQRQSGFNNLALAITMLLSFLLHWSIEAKASLLIVLLIFLLLSGGNHAYSAIKEKNRKTKNLLRPLMSLLLILWAIPFLTRVL